MPSHDTFAFSHLWYVFTQNSTLFGFISATAGELITSALRPERADARIPKAAARPRLLE